jgi:hypothetical protein
VAKQYFLVFVIRNSKTDLSFHVSQATSERLAYILAEREWQSPGFLRFATMDGQSIAINLEQVQAIRYLWEPFPFVCVDVITDEKNDEEKDGDGDGDVVSIHLRDSETPISTYPSYPEELCDFFDALESAPESQRFPAFHDEDGELLQINAREIVWVKAPTHLIDEGITNLFGGDTAP